MSFDALQRRVSESSVTHEASRSGPPKHVRVLPKSPPAPVSFLVTYLAHLGLFSCLVHFVVFGVVFFGRPALPGSGFEKNPVATESTGSAQLPPMGGTEFDGLEAAGGVSHRHVGGRFPPLRVPPLPELHRLGSRGMGGRPRITYGALDEGKSIRRGRGSPPPASAEGAAQRRVRCWRAWRGSSR